MCCLVATALLLNNGCHSSSFSTEVHPNPFYEWKNLHFASVLVLYTDADPDKRLQYEQVLADSLSANFGVKVQRISDLFMDVHKYEDLKRSFLTTEPMYHAFIEVNLYQQNIIHQVSDKYTYSPMLGKRAILNDTKSQMISSWRMMDIRNNEFVLTAQVETNMASRDNHERAVAQAIVQTLREQKIHLAP